MSDQEDVMSSLIEESKDHLENIEPDFLEMEQQGTNTSPDLINRIFRAMHSIKGGFGFFGKKNIVELAHIMENVLMLVRDGQAQVNEDMTQALIDGNDCLRTMIDDVENSESVSIEEYVEKIKPFASQNNDSPTKVDSKEDQNEKKSIVLDPIPSEYHDVISDKLNSNEFVFVVLFSNEHKPENFHNEISALGDIIYSGDLLSESALVFNSVIDKDMVLTLNWPESHKVIDLLNGEELPKPAKPKKEAKSTPAKKSQKSNESIRVRTELLGKLVDTAGEMVLGRNRIMDIVGKSICELPGYDEKYQTFSEQLSAFQQNILTMLNGSCNEDIKNTLDKEIENLELSVKDMVSARISDAPGVGTIFQGFSQISSELQNGIMGTRLQPVSTVFSKFPRVIRDINKKLGKDIELFIEGGEVELDKTVIEGLGDPLTHLVRNSADHGIEKPADRELHGKSRKGKVKLIARHDGGQVLIIIEDDGAGINVDRIKQKAVDNKMLTPEEASNMPDKEAFHLIFAAGFSTAETVSDVSGRGVGMDVVRTNIEKLGGRIEIDSHKGIGTTITLVMPLTLAIIPSLGVTAAGKHYAIPQVAIDELVRVIPEEASERIATVSGKPVLKLRNMLLPLVRLTDVLKEPLKKINHEGNSFEDRRQNIADRRSEELNDPKPSSDDSHERGSERRSPLNNKMYIVVLKASGANFGLIVDKLHEPQEVVVKPLSERFKGIEVYAGATIRSDGSVSMILDADGIARDVDIRADLSTQSDDQFQHANIREAQTMLEFKTGTEDHFAVNLSMVARVEEISLDDLHKTGDREFLKYQDSSLRVIRLSDHLNVSRPESDPKRFFVLVPKLVPHPIGILIEKPEGIFETDAEIDTAQFMEKGIHGSQSIDSRIVIFLDLYSLFEKVAPEVYQCKKTPQLNLKDKKVLFAEDTALFRTVVGNFLKSIFNHVEICENGALAWDALQDESYDLVVTDIVMPEMDGLQLARSIKNSELHKNIPVIAVTSLMNDSDRKRIKDAGVDEYQPKLNKESLRASILNMFQLEEATV